MIAARTTLRRLWDDSRGATAIEYGLIISLIIVVMIGGLSALGGGAGGMWTDMSDQVAAAL